ncbi:MAG: ABC transporter substrate-binding protein [Rikenellaceae bacterium]|jgi:iron complex transport system substrate-binding protein|nr:ABC transporter substrate-binding protein [Rikenellaceae bacterium]
MKKLLLLFLTVPALWGCPQPQRAQTGDLDTLYMPSHARGFEIYGSGKSAVIRIKNPWQGARNVDHWVFVSRGGELPPEGFDGVVITSPVKKTACMSSSHVALLDALGRAGTIKAVSGLRYLANESIHKAAAQGKVKDVGYEGNINYEMLVMLHPDVVFMYSVSGEKLPVIDKMRELRVPVVMIGEYLEPSPLGKAEWVVAFGEIMGCRERAEELFRGVSLDYAAAAQLARGAAAKPGVMLNAPWRDTWFVPGDQSYMVRLIRDAGGRYVCEGVDSEQSRAINGETAFMYADKADYWLNINSISSMAELLQLNPNFADIPPVRSGRVWNNTLRATAAGGSDFWESGAVYPNLVLQDLIHILHPDLLPDHEMVYYKPVR